MQQTLPRRVHSEGEVPGSREPGSRVATVVHLTVI